MVSRNRRARACDRGAAFTSVSESEADRGLSWLPVQPPPIDLRRLDRNGQTLGRGDLGPMAMPTNLPTIPKLTRFAGSEGHEARLVARLGVVPHFEIEQVSIDPNLTSNNPAPRGAETFRWRAPFCLISPPAPTESRRRFDGFLLSFTTKVITPVIVG